jgi:hypothetical protein
MPSEDGDLRRDDSRRSAAGIFEGTNALVADESVDRFLQRFDKYDPSLPLAYKIAPLIRKTNRRHLMYDAPEKFRAALDAYLASLPS